MNGRKMLKDGTKTLADCNINGPQKLKVVIRLVIFFFRRQIKNCFFFLFPSQNQPNDSSRKLSGLQLIGMSKFGLQKHHLVGCGGGLEFWKTDKMKKIGVNVPPQNIKIIFYFHFYSPASSSIKMNNKTTI